MFSDKLNSKINEILKKESSGIMDIDSSIRINQLLGNAVIFSMVFFVCYSILEHWGTLGKTILCLFVLYNFSIVVGIYLNKKRNAQKHAISEKIREEISKEMSIDSENIHIEEI